MWRRHWKDSLFTLLRLLFVKEGTAPVFLQLHLGIALIVTVRGTIPGEVPVKEGRQFRIPDHPVLFIALAVDEDTPADTAAVLADRADTPEGSHVVRLEGRYFSFVHKAPPEKLYGNGSDLIVPFRFSLSDRIHRPVPRPPRRRVFPGPPALPLRWRTVPGPETGSPQASPGFPWRSP